MDHTKDGILYDEERKLIEGIAFRIKKAREERCLSYAELAELSGVSKSSLQRYETGATQKISFAVLQRIEKALGLFEGTLMGWRRSESKTIDLKPALKKVSVLYDYNPRKTEKPLIFTEKDVFEVPDKVLVNADFCVIAKDDSMARSRIEKGDIVFVDSTAKTERGEIGVVYINGEIKICHIINGIYRTKFYTSDTYWSEESYNLEEDGIVYLGKAVAVQYVLTHDF